VRVVDDEDELAAAGQIGQRSRELPQQPRPVLAHRLLAMVDGGQQVGQRTEG